MGEFLYVCSPEFYCYSYLWRILFCAWTYFSSASVWCATWLSVFYCVKITNFAHRFIMWLKPRIDVFVLRVLGLSLTVFSFPFAALRMNIYCNPMGNMTGNTSREEDSNNAGIFISLQVTFIAINVSICLTASILLLISLWRHTRNLKRSGIATKDLNTQAHINVVNSLSFFLFFYILFAVAVTFYLHYSLALGVVEVLAVGVAMSLCPSAHSIILILTNPKLKEESIRILNIKRRTS
ncbi:taste receptor type 2 member 105-like [Tiliqua scincoides]|uniref:taste receptor type 2 member 105-like n=1 Tax=Tiliqua scincoides TaxID=71010 RepID=UPI00346268CC